MKRMFFYTILFCFILTGLALANLKTKEIIAGKSVGGLKLGTTVKQLKAMIGEPDKIEKGENNQKYYVYNYDADKQKEYGFLITIEKDKIISIYVYGDNFVLDGKIKVGSSSQKIMEKYKSQIDKNYYIMAENKLGGLNIIFPRIGIGFMLKEDKKKNDELITNIMILEPIPNWVKK